MGIFPLGAKLPIAGGVISGPTAAGGVGLNSLLNPLDSCDPLEGAAIIVDDYVAEGFNPLSGGDETFSPAQRFIPRFSMGPFRPATDARRAISLIAARGISDMEELVAPVAARRGAPVEDDKDGDTDDAPGRNLLRAISKIQIYLSKNIKTPDDKKIAESSARLVAKILRAIIFGGNPLAREAFRDQFNHRRHILENVMEYVDQVTGLKFHFSGDGELNIEVVSTPPRVRDAMDDLRSAMSSGLHDTPFEADVIAMIEQYAVATPNPATRHARVIDRVSVYQALIAGIEAVFKLFGVPFAAQAQFAVKALAQFHGEVKGQKHILASQTTRRVWAMVPVGLNLQPTQAQAREIIKRHYLLDDRTVNGFIKRIPKEFREAVVLYVVKRLPDWDELSMFKNWLDRIVQELEAAKEAFEDAHEFLGLHISGRERADFAARVVHEITNVRTSKRTGVQKMKMFGWRETAKASSLKEVRWPKVAEFVAKALGVAVADVDRAFGMIEYARYRAYVADAVLKREDAYSALSNAVTFIRKSAKRLRHSISQADEMQRILPGGIEAKIRKRPEVVISALKREPGVELQGRKLAAVLVPLIGSDRLLQPFSAATAETIEQIGIVTYFGSYYPDVHDLPQPLIEASLKFIAAMKKKHHDKVHSHRRRAVGYKGLLDIVDRRLDRVSDLEKRAKIRGEAVDWLAKFDNLPEQGHFRTQFEAWLKYRKKLSADVWQEMAGVAKSYALAEAKRLLAASMPKRFCDQRIEERIVTAMFDYVRGISDRGAASRSLIRRARFYGEALQNIDRAADVLDIRGEDAVSFALDIIDSVNSMVGGRKVYGEESARRAVWLAVNDKYARNKVIKIFSAVLEEFYGRPVLDLLPQTRENPRLLLDFLFSIVKRLGAYDRFSGFAARAEMLEANGKMKKARGE